MKEINIMIGRFQPFTKGHYKCVEEARRVKDVPTVICMIDTPDNKVDEKHPFPSSMLLPMYKDMFQNDKNIEDIILVKSADIVKIADQLKQYKIVSWTCGTDRIEDYKKFTDKYHDQAGLADDFEMIEIKRTGEDISATKVRQALLDDKKADFVRMTPPMHLSTRLRYNIYTILREQILDVYKGQH